MYSLLSWTIQARKALLYVNTCLYLHVSEKNYKEIHATWTHIACIWNPMLIFCLAPSFLAYITENYEINMKYCISVKVWHLCIICYYVGLIFVSFLRLLYTDLFVIYGFGA